jgi:hypothetical protein
LINQDIFTKIIKNVKCTCIYLYILFLEYVILNNKLDIKSNIKEFDEYVSKYIKDGTEHKYLKDIADLLKINNNMKLLYSELYSKNNYYCNYIKNYLDLLNIKYTEEYSTYQYIFKISDNILIYDFSKETIMINLLIISIILIILIISIKY